LYDKQPRTAEDVMIGITRILWGLTKKVVFADNIGHYVNLVYDVANLDTITNSEIVLATWLFGFQIYLDFSAYSDIAIGLARMMGIQLSENFKHPYISKNIGEFWQRWHISLSTWLRDYLFFPLGGSKKGLTRTSLNLFIVFFLGGLWHGSNGTFIIWGLLVGITTGIYYFLIAQFNHKSDPNRRLYVRDLLGMIVTFQIFSFSRVFFRANSVEQGVTMLQRLVIDSDWTSIAIWDFNQHVEVHLLLLFVSIVHLLRGIGIDRRLHSIRNPILIGIFWSAILILMFVFHAEGIDESSEKRSFR
jgi:alginate O-acetyltransferase complex protein AlgI